ncbi:hypothetical protein OUZ56_014620 [Daphnia magna]|uniref:Uncharacterized protein n=1 Tax=Daphnia magna TaxID=35525 RepID=A0ABR0AKB4_9CRUS|nr:hypothetical protein OUZ56_014620 [Daphnia magna]
MREVLFQECKRIDRLHSTWNDESDLARAVSLIDVALHSGSILDRSTTNLVAHCQSMLSNCFSFSDRFFTTECRYWLSPFQVFIRQVLKMEKELYTTRLNGPLLYQKGARRRKLKKEKRYSLYFIFLKHAGENITSRWMPPAKNSKNVC